MFDTIPNRYSVIPVRNKIPLVKWQEFINRRATEEEMSAWQTFGEYDRGIVTGPVSGIFVLDIDGEKGLQEAKRRGLPRTVWAKTRKGYHFYFKWTTDLDNKITTRIRISEEMDVRGHSGYVVFYGWQLPPHIVPLASPPKWLLDALPNKDKREIPDSFQSKPDDWMLRELENVDPSDPVNGRTPTFARVIGWLKHQGLKEVQVKFFLKPWADKYSYPKLDALVDDLFQRYPPKQDAVPSDLFDGSLKKFMADKKVIPYIIPGFIGEKTINVFAGLQESRKTWLLLDMAVAVASGTPWLGKYPCKRRKVLYLDQERPKEEMQRRLEALIAGRGLTLEDTEGFLMPKAGVEPPFRLNLDPSFTLFERLLETLQPDLVLVDSLKASQSGDIMSSNDMQRLFERLKALRLKYGITFVLLHHENKGTYAQMREKNIVTAENIEGSGTINQVPEGLFIARNFDVESTMLHHVKNSYGMKVPPFLVRVKDLVPDQSKIAVEAM